jgi:methionyl-tRNA synthetase
MLIAAGLEVPTGVFGHGWLLVGGEKMSKSKLTGIAPAQITDTFGSDAFRFYFLSAIHFGQDGSFSWEDLAARYQAELANGFGNLASRVIAMIGRYCDGEVPAGAEQSAADHEIVRIEREATDGAWSAIQRLQIHEAIASAWTLVDALNGYLTAEEPWALAKDPHQRERLETVLATAYHGLGTLAVLLSPVLPKATAKLWSALGAEGAVDDQRIDLAYEWPIGTRVSALEPLFPRVEVAE